MSGLGRPRLCACVWAQVVCQLGLAGLGQSYPGWLFSALTDKPGLMLMECLCSKRWQVLEDMGQDYDIITLCSSSCWSIVAKASAKVTLDSKVETGLDP